MTKKLSYLLRLVHNFLTKMETSPTQYVPIYLRLKNLKEFDGLSIGPLYRDMSFILKSRSSSTFACPQQVWEVQVQAILISKQTRDRSVPILPIPTQDFTVSETWELWIWW